MTKKTIASQMAKNTAHWLFLSMSAMITFTQANVNTLVISSFRDAASFIHRNGVSLEIRNPQADIWQSCVQENVLRQYVNFPFTVSNKDCAVITPDCRCYNWAIEETAHVFQIGQCVYIRIPPADINITLTWNLVYTYPYLPPGYQSAVAIFYRRLYTQQTNFDTYVNIASSLFCEAIRSLTVVRLWNTDLYAVQQHFLNITFSQSPNTQSKPPDSVGPTALLLVATVVFLTYLGFHQVIPLYVQLCSLQRHLP